MKTLITGALKIEDCQIKELEELGLEITYIKNENKKLNINVEKFEFVICNSLFLNNEIEAFKSLKYIQVTSAGLDRLPLEYIKEKNIQIFNARGVYSIPIAEFIISKILDVYKKSFEFYENQKKCAWVKNRELEEITGKTVTIVGYGSIGKEIAKRLYNFDIKINVVDIENTSDKFVNTFYKIEEIEKSIRISDIVILTVPLTDKTKNMFNEQLLKQMKEDVILVNTSRGEIIDEKSLIKELEQGRFKAVILDVFKEEPLKEDSKLWKFNNVIITPHNSFVSNKNVDRLYKLIIHNVRSICNE